MVRRELRGDGRGRPVCGAFHGRISLGRAVLAGLLMLPSLGAPASGQEPDRPRIRVKSEVALLDLVVTDGNGALIGDLTADEIEIMQDGSRREIVFFDRFDRPGIRAPSEGGPAGPDPAAVSRPVPFIFVVDLNSMDESMLNRVKEAIRVGLTSDAIGEGEHFMVVTVGDGVQARSPLTGEVALVLESLQGLQPARAVRTYSDLYRRIEKIYRTSSGNRADSTATDLAVVEAKLFLNDLHSRIASTTEDLSSLGEYLQVIEQRKSLVYFSGGYPLGSGPMVLDLLLGFYDIYGGMAMIRGTNSVPRAILSAKLGGAITSSQLPRLSSAVQSLNRDQTAVYSVDARGLMAKTLVTSGTSLGGGRMSPMNPIVRRLDAADIIAPQSFLTILSKQTGGRVFMNRNDLETGIEGVRSDARTYYLVGIIPEDGSGEGPVEVRVSRAGARVLVRSDWFTRKASADELESAFRFPGFYRDFEMDTVVSVAAGTLKVSVDIPTEALVFEPELGRQRCTIQIRGRVLDAAGKWIGSGFLLAKLFPIALEETQLEALRLRPAVTAAAQARLPAGARDLIIVVRQEPSGLTATYSAGLPSAGQ